jgi:hypothetical protein
MSTDHDRRVREQITDGLHDLYTEPARPRLRYQVASDVKAVPPEWHWRGWLVAGAVQLLVGRQGCGKSTFAAWTVAQLSTGRPWPGETDHRPPVRCGMLSLEEPAERVKARLVANGADCDAVYIFGYVHDHDDDGRPYDRPWQLPGDCSVMEDAIREHGLAVVTIDGLGYSIRGDTHSYAIVGSALSALAGVAERTGCTLVGLTHPPKGNTDAVTSAIGSTAWTAVARITWVMGFDPTDETVSENDKRRVVRPAPGSNYRLPDHGLSFKIAEYDELEAGYVTSLQDSDVEPQTITSPPLPESDDERTARDDAIDFLRAYLAGGIEHKATEVQTAAHSELGRNCDRTLARARKDAGIVSRREGFGKGSVVWWSLPAIPAIDAIDATDSCQGAECDSYGDPVATMGARATTGAALPPEPLSPAEAAWLEGKLARSATEGWWRYGPGGTRTPVSDAEAAGELAARHETEEQETT